LKFKMRNKVSILSLFLFGLITGCKKNSPPTTNGGVPNVAVNFPGSTYDAGETNLQTIGGWVYVTFTGYADNGVILFRNSNGSILAFDRSCPYDCTANTKAIVTVQTNNIAAKCPVCGTTYSLYSGIVTKGPGSMALKQYTVNFDESSGDFTVTN
jgi:nitrite reductase/ring-hydroxylating ferredoxin subunit